MAKRRNNLIRFSRDYRRPLRRSAGVSPHRKSRSRRLADPRVYLNAVIVVASVGLILLPGVADATLAVTRPVASTGGACRIYRVVDGDTVRMWCADGGETPARLTGYDTPELFSPSCPSELAAAIRAKWALRQAIWQAETVELVREGEDRYGRALVALIVDGEPVQRRMIEDGHARPYAGGRRAGWCA
ncbi:thermonuclease family protein [Defluviimonas sp. WL0024]|uniref:Thermonuclease family protein n=1 Tax=Albidovulum salinarum TaxID=2984153 RepID=A0ABT2WZM9_9RHOB|nr:thermonuclease family protein [Defluviimonas sp. WL0024]MCU9847136.1 thermonuclease family protein [Defluviimonas sp. WL0024]